jgi:hypothetical protein
VNGIGRLWLRFGVAGALAAAFVGYPLGAAVVTGILTLLVKIETRS